MRFLSFLILLVFSACERIDTVDQTIVVSCFEEPDQLTIMFQAPDGKNIERTPESNGFIRVSQWEQGSYKVSTSFQHDESPYLTMDYSSILTLPTTESSRTVSGPGSINLPNTPNLSVVGYEKGDGYPKVKISDYTPPCDEILNRVFYFAADPPSSLNDPELFFVAENRLESEPVDKTDHFLAQMTDSAGYLVVEQITNSGFSRSDTFYLNVDNPIAEEVDLSDAPSIFVGDQEPVWIKIPVDKNEYYQMEFFDRDMKGVSGNDLQMSAYQSDRSTPYILDHRIRAYDGKPFHFKAAEDGYAFFKLSLGPEGEPGTFQIYLTKINSVPFLSSHDHELIMTNSELTTSMGGTLAAGSYRLSVSHHLTPERPAFRFSVYHGYGSTPIAYYITPGFSSLSPREVEFTLGEETEVIVLASRSYWKVLGQRVKFELEEL
ncbi:MAG: hypothetical protein WEC59_10970 [Salibacteraceae bacterium]